MTEQSLAVERRHHHHLRAIFDDAYARIEPFLDPTQTWGGVPLMGLAYRELREAYPDLSAAEAHILVVAIVRVYRMSHGRLAPRLLRPDGLAPAQ
jgi:hypothetical protein